MRLPLHGVIGQLDLLRDACETGEHVGLLPDIETAESCALSLQGALALHQAPSDYEGVLEDVLQLQRTGHDTGEPRIRERTELALDQAVIRIASIATSREIQRDYVQSVRRSCRSR